MYDDFKRRVCDGRGIEMDVVEQIAGGRVMSGLRAFEIVAPPELIKQVKGIEDDIPAQGDGSTVTVMEGAATDSTASTGEARGDDTVATLPEDQETSPFAVPEVLAAGTSTSTLPSARTDGSSEPASISDKSASPVSSTPSAASAAVSPTEVSAASAVLDTPEAHAEQALKTASSSADEAKSKVFQRPTSSPPAAQNGAAGMYDYTPGPFGRGLVDGLGGLRDSAVYACQLFVSPGLLPLERPSAGRLINSVLRSRTVSRATRRSTPTPPTRTPSRSCCRTPSLRFRRAARLPWRSMVRMLDLYGRVSTSIDESLLPQ